MQYIIRKVAMDCCIMMTSTGSLIKIMQQDRGRKTLDVMSHSASKC